MNKMSSGAEAGGGGSGGPTAEEDLTIPRAAMNKMIKEILPSIRVANESRELILNCCTEFIHLISSEANEICNQHTKKTISPEHILQALDKLDFGDFRQEAQAVMEDCKQIASKRRRQSTRLENLGIPEEELLRQQQELFAKAREEQAAVEQQQWQMLQFATQMANMQQQQQQQQQGINNNPNTTTPTTTGTGPSTSSIGSIMVPPPTSRSLSIPIQDDNIDDEDDVDNEQDQDDDHQDEEAD